MAARATAQDRNGCEWRRPENSDHLVALPPHPQPPIPKALGPAPTSAHNLSSAFKPAGGRFGRVTHIGDQTVDQLLIPFQQLQNTPISCNGCALIIPRYRGSGDFQH